MAKVKEKTSDIKKYREDILFFRMSCLFILDVLAIVGLFKLNEGRNGYEFWKFCRNPIALAVVGLLLIGAVIFKIVTMKKGTDESVKSFSSMNLVAILAFLTATMLYWGRINNPNLMVLIAAVVALSLLYYIYFIYKKDFFLFTLSNVVFAAMLYLFSFPGLFGRILAAAFLALSAFMCYVTYKASKTELMNSKEKGGYRFCFLPIYISFGIAILLLAASTFFSLIGSAVVVVVMIFQYILAGVFYTIKLIKEA